MIKGPRIICSRTFYLGGIFFRAIRFRIILNKKEVRNYDLFTIVAVSNLINNILPARTGELSYIYLLKKLFKVPLKHGTASLVVVRIFDVISISLLLLLSILCLYPENLLPFQTQILIIILLILFISIWALIAICNGKLSVIIAKISTLLKIRKFNFIGRIIKMLYEVEENLINIYTKKIFYFFSPLILFYPLYPNRLDIFLPIQCIDFFKNFFR